MVIRAKKLFKFINEIQQDAKTQKPMDTGLLGEQLIISAYKKMELEKLIKLRFILNKIIKEKKEYKRITKNDTDDPDTDTNAIQL